MDPFVHKPSVKKIHSDALETGQDAVVHVAEEVKNPAKVVPWAITIAIGFTYIAGFLFNIVLAFCMGDPEEILASPIFQPVSSMERRRDIKQGFKETEPELTGSLC